MKDSTRGKNEKRETFGFIILLIILFLFLGWVLKKIGPMNTGNSIIYLKTNVSRQNHSYQIFYAPNNPIADIEVEIHSKNYFLKTKTGKDGQYKFDTSKIENQVKIVFKYQKITYISIFDCPKSDQGLQTFINEH